jgi:hypothetical protein
MTRRVVAEKEASTTWRDEPAAAYGARCNRIVCRPVGERSGPVEAGWRESALWRERAAACSI